MNPLNNDELNALLEQAKRNSPAPPRELAARTVQAYQANILKRKSWQAYLLQPVSLPWPVGLLAAVLFVLIGALVDQTFRRPSIIDRSRAPVTLPYQPIAILTFEQFQPVSEIRPRVIRSVRDDH